MEVSLRAMRLFAHLLQERTGQELGAGRSWRVEAALRPLLKPRGIASLDGLAAAVTGGRDADLADAVVEALLNNETSFFRDPPVFRGLIGDAIGRILDPAGSPRRLRIWCAGCSTGQEVYSIAMLIAAEAQHRSGATIDLIGTDISASAIAQARSGLYSQFEIQRGLPVRDMIRWFDPEGENWRARPELRLRTRFETGNLLDPAGPAIRADIVLCRNVLLYLGPDKRRRIFERLVDSLSENGRLVLGAGETVLGQTDLFEPDPACQGMYRRTADAKPVTTPAILPRAGMKSAAG